jgi:hypothetical protein
MYIFIYIIHIYLYIYFIYYIYIYLYIYIPFCSSLFFSFLSSLFLTVVSTSLKILYSFIFLPLLLCWVGVHCDIYKGSYNVSTMSYLNSPLLPVVLYPPLPHSWNSFNRYPFLIFHLHSYIYILCTLFTLLSIFPTTSPPHTGANTPPGQDLFHHLVFQFCRKEKRKNMTFLLGVSLSILILVWRVFQPYLP